MSTATVAAGYTPDDLVWLPEAMGGRVELDPWGNAVVSPASDPHLLAVNLLKRLLDAALGGRTLLVLAEGPAWQVPGGSGYTNVADLTVLQGPRIARDPRHEWHLSPPPLLIVEVASPSTRTIDRTRKRDDYLLGGAHRYLLVDLPGLAPVPAPALELWTATDGAWTTTAAGPSIGLDLEDGRQVTIEAAALA